MKPMSLWRCHPPWLWGLLLYACLCGGKIVPKPSATSSELICWEDTCNTRDLCPACCDNRVAQENQCAACVAHKCSIHVLGLERREVQAAAVAARLRGAMQQEKQESKTVIMRAGELESKRA